MSKPEHLFHSDRVTSICGPSPALSTQIVPLIEGKPPKLPKPERTPVAKLTTHDRFIESQWDNDRLQRELESAEGKVSRLEEELKAKTRQFAEVCRFKDRCIEDTVEFFESGLSYGIWENRIQMRRRISRLKGAKGYKGNS